MNDLLGNPGLQWIWIVGIFLLVSVLWGIIKAARERNPTRRKPDSSPRQIAGELSEDEIKKDKSDQ
jgi:hypothetical protein